MADLTDDIETSAAGPKSVSVDGQSTTEHSLPEQIEADRYLKEASAGNKSKLPIRLGKLRPSGT